MEVDTKGWRYATYVVNIGATDVAMTALAVTESDTTGSGHANVTGLVTGTSTNIAGSTSALPTSTADNDLRIFDIDLQGRKRFLDLTATAGDGSTGTYLSAICILSDGEIGPITAAERGASIDILRV